MAKTFQLGVFGLGTVGSGLVDIIHKRAESVEAQLGVRLEVKTAVIQNPEKKRACDTDGLRITTDFNDILEDKAIDIVVELIGGTADAYEIVKKAIERKKPVVTANKALIAERGAELFRLAKNNQVPLFAEASVGGGIPVLKALRESLIANRITKLAAIINGTTNFILTKMEEEGLSYFEALKLAGDLGFAEADPTFDVEGIDAKQKIHILAAHILGGVFPEGEILAEGITNLDASDFRFAKAHAMTIKLLALAEQKGERIELRVHPTLIKNVHPLASIRNEFNAVMLEGDAVGEVVLAGRGAGSFPTASAVYGDIIDICTKIEREESAGHHVMQEALAIVPTDEIESEYYIRFTIEDRPGVIGEVSSILGSFGISVSTVSAELIENVPELGELEIVVHKTKEANVKAAIAKINELSRVQGAGKYIRILSGA